jgi:hypothetical protein
VDAFQQKTLSNLTCQLKTPDNRQKVIEKEYGRKKEGLRNERDVMVWIISVHQRPHAKSLVARL